MIEHPNVKERSLFEILRSTAKKKMMKRKNISRLAKFDKNMCRVSQRLFQLFVFETSLMKSLLRMNKIVSQLLSYLSM